MTLFLTKTSISEQKLPPWHLFFSQFVLCHASNNTTSRNIEGDGCMGRPPPQTLGAVPPVPLSHHPCTVADPGGQIRPRPPSKLAMEFGPSSGQKEQWKYCDFVEK